MAIKNELSKININVSLGFLYWLNEDRNLRGLKNVSIKLYPSKLDELRRQYDKKYPDGLTGWSKDD